MANIGQGQATPLPSLPRPSPSAGTRISAGEAGQVGQALDCRGHDGLYRLTSGWMLS